MKGLKVQCPNCKKVMWETTDKYDPNVPPNGSMVVLIEPYRSNSWPIFGDGVMRGTAATKRAEMDCPNCLAQLAPSGRLRVLAPVEEVKEPEVPQEPETPPELDGPQESETPSEPGVPQEPETPPEPDGPQEPEVPREEIVEEKLKSKRSRSKK